MDGDGYAHPHHHHHAPPPLPMHQQQPPPPFHNPYQHQHQHQHHQPPMMPLHDNNNGGGMHFPPPQEHQQPQQRHAFDTRPTYNDPPPDFRGGGGRLRSESRGRDFRNNSGGGYDRFRGNPHNGPPRRSRSRSHPRGGNTEFAPRPQHRPSGEWDSAQQQQQQQQQQRKATHAIEPMDSYKVFMMRQDENATPETYLQRYEEYKKKYTQRVMRAFFDDHKKHEWLQERYSPAIKARLDVQKRAKKIAEAKSFCDRVRSGVASINLDEQAIDLSSSKDWANDLEDSARILYIRRIPCACPVSSLSESILGESIKKAGGNFQQIYLSDPVKKSAFDFDRTAYIVYETPAAAADALPKIHNTFVQDADAFAPFRLQVSQHRSRAPLKTPSYLNVPERVAFDCLQARALATALDRSLFTKDADLRRFGIDALLAHDDVMTQYNLPKQQLDVTIAYLRRVHHYIYYAGTQCLDMGDIMHAHPALFCRPEPTARDVEDAKAREEAADKEETTALGSWAASLDEKVQAYIQQLDPTVVAADKAKQQALVSEIEAREEAALEPTYANYCEKAGDDGKHRCRLCTKLFKAADFVKKHIRNKHMELVVDKIADVGESYMWEAYREDPNRPLPPIETTNTLLANNATLGRSGGNNSFQVRNSNHNHARGSYNNSNSGPPPQRNYRHDGPRDGGGFRGRSRDRSSGPRRESFGPPRSPPRRESFGSSRSGTNERLPPRELMPIDSDLPVDPRQVTKSYQDLDNLQDTKVELSFDALDSLPPPKKKSKV